MSKNETSCQRKYSSKFRYTSFVGQCLFCINLEFGFSAVDGWKSLFPLADIKM